MELLWHQRGSVLAYTLIVLFFIFVSAISLAVISSTERRTAISTDKSGRAFQIADSGIETILQKIYKESENNSSISSFTTSPDVCNEGIITHIINSSNKYEASFIDNDGNLLGCSDTRGEIIKLKVRGMSGNTTRVVEVGIKL